MVAKEKEQQTLLSQSLLSNSPGFRKFIKKNRENHINFQKILRRIVRERRLPHLLQPEVPRSELAHSAGPPSARFTAVAGLLHRFHLFDGNSIDRSIGRIRIRTMPYHVGVTLLCHHIGERRDNHTLRAFSLYRVESFYSDFYPRSQQTYM